MHHLGDLLVSHRLPQLLAHLFYLLEVDRARLLRIVEIEYLQQPLLGPRIS